jgi:hypothetical protein
MKYLSFSDKHYKLQTALSLITETDDTEVKCMVCKAMTTVGNAKLCPDVHIALGEFYHAMRIFAKIGTNPRKCGCADKGEGESDGKLS